MMAKNVDGAQASEHIIKQLEKNNIPFRVRSGSAMITCPYHPCPSVFPDASYLRLSINLNAHWYENHYIPVGFCRCWSCGKVCHFNDLIENKDNEIPPFKHRLFKNLKPLPKSGTAEDTQLFSKDVSFKEDEDVFIDVNSYWKDKWHGSWRSIEEKTLLKMGASSYFDYDPNNKKSTMGVNRLLFYAYNKDKEKIGWIALSDNKARKKKYILKQKNMPGSWVSKTFLFHEKFPNDVPLLLTEGPYDALRMIQEGFNAISMLGAGSWSEDKKLLLVGKASHVIILFDGDETGYEKSLKVYKDLKDYIPTKRLLLPIIGGNEDKDKNLDPGNMPDKYVRIVRKKLNKFVEEN